MTQEQFLTNPLSLALPGEVPHFDQVVDTVFDALRAGAIIEHELADGFQWTDIFGLRSIPDIVTEIVADVPDFVSQITKIGGDQAVEAILEARAKLETINKGGKVVAFIANALTLVAKGYATGSELFEDFQNLLEGNDVTA